MLRIRLLGTPIIERDSKPLPPFKSRKVLALLAYLALNPGTHTRSHLAGLLWSDCPEKKALDNLRFALWNLNEVLRTTVCDADRVSVAWRAPPHVTLDTDEFTRLIHAGESSPHVWQRLAELYRGDLLAGFDLPNDVLFNEWLERERTRLREYVLDALYRLAQFHLAQRHLPDAITSLRRLLEFDPWREEAHRLLMLALARNGQRTAAPAQYVACKQMLATELGVPPSAPTMHLYERIRIAENLPRHNLPSSFTPFIGRTKEFAEILALLNQPECRLLTVAGAGGIGKTRLALAVATACIERFLHGVRWIALEAVRAPEQLIPTIAATLDLESRGGNPLDALSDFLRDKEMLLVLDNVEQLRAGAAILTELLRRAPDVKILATSRERLNLQSEWVYVLDGLAFPRVTRDDPATFEAVQLFVQAAQRVQHCFALNAVNAPAIVRICQLVEGLPLGIELAATLGTNYDAVARTLERDLTTLVTTMPDALPRHRSLSAAFEHSWRLLDEHERAVFRRLAVFRGGFDQVAAMQIAQATTHTLDALVRQSLVRARAPRYAMLETVRQFADEKLCATPEDAEQTHHAHARYYADLLHARRTDLRLGKSDALAQVSEDIHNIRAAWQWGIAHAQMDILERAAEGLGSFLEVRSWTQEGAALFAQAHDLAEMIEKHLRAALPRLSQVTIHVEPEESQKPDSSPTDHP
ncbi:MAG: NB-ARC domain-containing protein [Anaerolineae bacterium]|nr:NB-ARC domain-containing protein [Anaerolineae bacterium]